MHRIEKCRDLLQRVDRALNIHGNIVIGDLDGEGTPMVVYTNVPGNSIYEITSEQLQNERGTWIYCLTEYNQQHAGIRTNDFASITGVVMALVSRVLMQVVLDEVAGMYEEEKSESWEGPF